jgi:Rrf2 family iron-sulfur cluster assembly transcriptional regulator
MHLNPKSCHAIRAMMHLAIYAQDKPIGLKDMADCQGVSVSYLTQLFVKLRKVGLVKGIHGPEGGYCLGKPASEISIAMILIAIKPMTETPYSSEDLENIFKEGLYLADIVWHDFNKEIFNFLNHIMLSEFVF